MQINGIRVNVFAIIIAIHKLSKLVADIPNPSKTNPPK